MEAKDPGRNSNNSQRTWPYEIELMNKVHLSMYVNFRKTQRNAIKTQDDLKVAKELLKQIIQTVTTREQRYNKTL